MTRALPLAGRNVQAVIRAVTVYKQSCGEVAARFGITAQRVRRIIEWEMAGRVVPTPEDMTDAPVVTTSKPPPEILQEAIRAYAAPRSLVGELMGDPLPGRSALDQKRQLRVVT